MKRYVVRYPDGTYFVRTYEVISGRWCHVSSRVATMRDIAQSVISGGAFDVDYPD